MHRGSTTVPVAGSTVDRSREAEFRMSRFVQPREGLMLSRSHLRRFTTLLASSALVVVGAVTAVPAAAGGAIDTSFLAANGTGATRAGGASGSVVVTAEQPDGKVLVGGLFEFWDSVPVGRLVRLNADGSLDTAFTAANGTGAAHTVSSIAVQPDGKILLAGSFRSWNGTKAERITRLNTDGSLDTTFASNVSDGANNTASALALQSDGKIVLGGGFTAFNSVAVPRIVRLNADGTTDATFSSTLGTGPDSSVKSLALQVDGKILVGGDFTGWGSSATGRIVRLSADGSVDPSFVTGTGGDNRVGSVRVQSDGWILLGGRFTTWNGTAVGGVVRLSSAGAIDLTFTSNTGNGGGGAEVLGVVPLTTGGIAVTGLFTTWDSTVAGYAVVLDSDGIRDAAFTAVGADNSVYPVTEQSDGFLLVPGKFTTWDGTAAGGLVRLTAGSGGGGSGGGGSGAGGSVVRVPDVIQQYPIAAELAVGSPVVACEANAPGYVVDGRVSLERQFDAWTLSYAQWPNDGAGGYVCTRTLSYQASADMWLTASSVVTGSGVLQQYAIGASAVLRMVAEDGMSDAAARVAYCRTHAPDSAALGRDWGQRNEGWRPSYASWLNGGAGGWVCSRTL